MHPDGTSSSSPASTSDLVPAWRIGELVKPELVSWRTDRTSQCMFWGAVLKCLQRVQLRSGIATSNPCKIGCLLHVQVKDSVKNVPWKISLLWILVKVKTDQLKMKLRFLDRAWWYITTASPAYSGWGLKKVMPGPGAVFQAVSDIDIEGLRHSFQQFLRINEAPNQQRS